MSVFKEEIMERELDELWRGHYLSTLNTPAMDFLRNRGYEGSVRILSTEDLTTEVKRWVGSRARLIQERIKTFESGLARMELAYDKLPDDPNLKTSPIEGGSWTIPLTDEGSFEPQLAIKFSKSKQSLAESGKELFAAVDSTEETGFSKLIAGDRMKRAGLDRNTSAALRVARMFSFTFGRGQLTYLLPGALLLIVSPNTDGTNSVKWRKITYEGKFISFYKSKNDETVDPISSEEYRVYKDAIKDLLTIYRRRIKGHSEMISEIERIKAEADSAEGKTKKRYLKELNGAITVEEAFTNSVKRCIDGLLDYVKHSMI